MHRPTKPPGNAQYIGDGVWGWHDGYQVWIGTYTGFKIEELIALNPETMQSLVQFAVRQYGSGIVPP